MARGELTRKQRMFAAEYRIDFNGTQAAIRAGYSAKTAEVQASVLLRNAKVVAEVSRLQDEAVKATGITAAWVLGSLQKVANRCLQEEPVLDREGNPTGEFQFQAAGANKALELLGKHLALFTDNMNIRKIKSPDDLTDEEAIAIAKKIKEAEINEK